MGRIWNFVIGFALLFSAQAFAANAITRGFNFDGVLTDPGGTTPITSATAVTFQILNATETCILYSETQTITPDSGGNFSAIVGTGGSALDSSDSGNQWDQVFSNDATVSGKLVSNSSACSYVPVAGDARYLHLKIAGTAATPNIALGSVPFATVADTLQGHPASDFVMDGMPITTPLVTLQNGGGTTMLSTPATGNFTLVFPPTPGSAGQFLQTDGAGNLSWQSAATAGVMPSNSSSYTFNSGTGGTGGFNFQVNGANAITVDGTGATTISGPTTTVAGSLNTSAVNSSGNGNFGSISTTSGPNVFGGTSTFNGTSTFSGSSTTFSSPSSIFSGNVMMNSGNSTFTQNWSLASGTASTITGSGTSSGNLLSLTDSSSSAQNGAANLLIGVSGGATTNSTRFGINVTNNATITGTGATNYGVQASAQNAAGSNYGGKFSAIGGTTQTVGGMFTASGGTAQNIGIQAGVTGTGTVNNTAAMFSATGSSGQNNAIIVPPSSGNVGIGTTSTMNSQLAVVAGPGNIGGLFTSTSSIALEAYSTGTSPSFLVGPQGTGIYQMTTVTNSSTSASCTTSGAAGAAFNCMFTTSYVPPTGSPVPTTSGPCVYDDNGSNRAGGTGYYRSGTIYFSGVIYQGSIATTMATGTVTCHLTTM
jgi:trimeric autotransporter adhesin